MSTYYVDATAGSDTNPGTSEGAAWRTLKHAAAREFRAGDRLLLARGGAWHEPMVLNGRGDPANPILLGAFGTGPRPAIHGGETHAVAAARPVGGWRISGLELTSTNASNPTRKIEGGTSGVFLSQEETGHGFVIDDCRIHDTSGPGIHFRGRGAPAPMITGAVIEGCEIWNASCGIQFACDGSFSTEFFPDFRIAHVDVHDIGGDGIVPFCSRDGVIEHCRAWRTGLGVDPKDHSPVAIWYAWSLRSVIQFCEAWDNHTGGRGADGGGFDLDGGCTDCVLQYNHSHDNDGAGFLICSWDPALWPCTGCVTRFNLSVNDGLQNDYGGITFWQATGCLTYNNTVIARKAPALKFLSDTRDHLIANNLFVADTAGDVPLVKSGFDVRANKFLHNLYHRTGGAARFEVPGLADGSFRLFAQHISGVREVNADPLLVDLAKPDVRLKAGSPARGLGLRIPAMGGVDFGRRPLPDRGPVDLGCMAMREDE
ncbi:MAG: right-handed parallel beta-helix repeat-containing protein [Candidatus Coatesbacteria bacterium]